MQRSLAIAQQAPASGQRSVPFFRNPFRLRKYVGKDMCLISWKYNILFSMASNFTRKRKVAEDMPC